MTNMDGYMSDPDIFVDDENEKKTRLFFTPSPKTPKKVESQEMIKLRSLMGGIPPPPEISNPQIDVETMLFKWNENKHLWLDDLKENDPVDTVNKFDVYINYDCEAEEVIRLKLAERLISSETSTSFCRKETMTNSAKKRLRRNGWAKSPGSRLSYLAKRRTTFNQRPNLGETRTISIMKGNKKPKNPAKKEINLKRALFQSPDKMDLSTPDSRSSKRLKLSLPSSPKASSAPKIVPNHRPRTSCLRNLESEFDSLTKRQKLLFALTPLGSLPTSQMKIM